MVQGINGMAESYPPQYSFLPRNKYGRISSILSSLRVIPPDLPELIKIFWIRGTRESILDVSRPAGAFNSRLTHSLLRGLHALWYKVAKRVGHTDKEIVTLSCYCRCSSVLSWRRFCVCTTLSPLSLMTSSFLLSLCVPK